MSELETAEEFRTRALRDRMNDSRLLVEIAVTLKSVLVLVDQLARDSTEERTERHSVRK